VLYPTTINPGVFDNNVESQYWSAVAGILREVQRNCLLYSLSGGELTQETAHRLARLDVRCAPQIKVLYNRLHDMRRFVTVPRLRAKGPQTNEDWLSEALALNRERELHTIVARGIDIAHDPDARSNKVCVGVESAALDNHWNQRRNAESPRRCAKEILPLLKPVLLHSRKVWLVDYLVGTALQGSNANQRRRFIETIKACVAMWRDAYVKRRELIVMTTTDSGHQRGYLEQISQPLKSALVGTCPADDSTVAIRFYFDPDKSFHRNRFLITERGCVQIGKGFDFVLGRQGQHDVLTLLEESAAQQVEDQLRPYKDYVEVTLR